MALGSTAAFQTGFGPTQSTGGFSNTAFGTAGIVGGFGFPIPGVDPLFSFTAAASSFTLQKLLGFANRSGTNINVGPIPSNMGMVGGILNGTPFFSNPSSLGGLAGDNPLAGALGSFLPGYGQGDNSGNGAGFSGLGNGTPFDNYVGGGQGGPQGAGNPYAQGRFPNGSIPGNPYPPGANGQQPNYALGYCPVPAEPQRLQRSSRNVWSYGQPLRRSTVSLWPNVSLWCSITLWWQPHQSAALW